MPPETFFSGSGLDRADLLRVRPNEVARLAEERSAREIVWRDGFPAIADDGRLEWRPLASPDLFLGLDGVEPRFSALQGAVGETRAAFASLALLHRSDAPIFASALSLAGWHLRHRYCANCGAATGIARGGWSRLCVQCAAEHFPRVDPVVIMTAEHDGRLLLGRQPHYPQGRYSALAGFVEVGESIEDAVVRELQEEAGISAVEVRYVASQPWPFPSSLMVGCHARAEDDGLTIDTTELDDARWFSRAEVVSALAEEAGAAFKAPPPFAIAHTLLRCWLAA